MSIKSIQITNYRAFLNLRDDERDRYYIGLPVGENLLIYGENGSGKSSLFNAVKDFISSAGDPRLPFSINRFYQPQQLSDVPSICIQFTEDPGTDYYYSQDRSQTNTLGCTHIAKGNAIYGFLSYKDLLKLHYDDAGIELDLFPFFFGEKGLFAPEILLTPQYAQNRVPFGELWNIIRRNQDPVAIEDYNINAAAIITGLGNTANRLLFFFEEDIQLEIKYFDASFDGRLLPPRIDFKVRLFGREVPAHHQVLNEARLTSVAISVYLAHLLSLPDVPFKFLFLDDIFVGLDTSNRLPLLEILSAESLGTPISFRNFQIFITTYDREWFELAKTYLKRNWKKIELYVDDYSAAAERPIIRKSESYREKAEAHLAAGDYPAAANYLRKAFENELVRILPGNILYPGLPDVSDKRKIINIPKSHFDLSEDQESWLFNIKEGMVSVPTENRYQSLNELIGKFESLVKKYNIPYSGIDELQMVRNRLLNPLSHDNIKSPVFKGELVRGLRLLDDLSTFRSEIIIDVEGTGSVILHADEVNDHGVLYNYRFEVLENVRYLYYGGFSILINGKCNSLDRTGPDAVPQPMPKEYATLARLCRGICKMSAAVYDISFELNRVFNSDGKKLIELVNEQN